MSEEVKFDEIININDPQFSEKLAAAIGLAPGEVIEVITPQFERTDGIKPIANPSEIIASIHKMSKEALIKIGLGQWGENGLWLFPYEWYEHIPEGMELMCIDGTTEPFKNGVTDDDYRFGCLAYGIVPDFERPSPTK